MAAKKLMWTYKTKECLQNLNNNNNKLRNYTLPPTQHHSFFRNLAPLLVGASDFLLHAVVCASISHGAKARSLKKTQPEYKRQAFCQWWKLELLVKFT